MIPVSGGRAVAGGNDADPAACLGIDGHGRPCRQMVFDMGPPPVRDNL